MPLGFIIVWKEVHHSQMPKPLENPLRLFLGVQRQRGFGYL